MSNDLRGDEITARPPEADTSPDDLAPIIRRVERLERQLVPPQGESAGRPPAPHRKPGPWWLKSLGFGFLCWLPAVALVAYYSGMSAAVAVAANVAWFAFWTFYSLAGADPHRDSWGG